MNREASMVEELLEPATLEDQQKQMLECESFSRDIFTKVIKSFIKDHLVPIVKDLVEQFMDQLKLKFDIQKG